MPLYSSSATLVDPNVFIIRYSWKFAQPNIRYKSVARLTYFWHALRRLADDKTLTLRSTGLPNPDAYKAAQKKYKHWDSTAITEYARLKAADTRNTLTRTASLSDNGRVRPSTPDTITCVSSRPDVSLLLSFL